VNCRKNRLLFADELVLHAWIFSTGSSVHIWSFFSSAACDQAGTKISTKKIEVLCLSGRPRQCILHVSGNTLQQVETFKFLGVVFTSDGSRNKGIDSRIGEANAILGELYCSVVSKQELTKTAKFSVFKSLFTPILTCGHESYVTTERILSKEQRADMGYLRRVLSVTFRDKEHRSEIRKAQDVKPLFRIERSQLCYSSAMYPACPRKEWRTKSFGLQSTSTGKRPRVRPRTRWRDYISDLAWSSHGVEPAELSEIAVDREAFRVILEFCCPAALPKGKSGTKMSGWMSM